MKNTSMTVKFLLSKPIVSTITDMYIKHTNASKHTNIIKYKIKYFPT